MSVRFALYIFDVYTNVFDGSHDCKGDMLDWDNKCHKSIERNFMVNDEQDFAFFILIKFHLSS